MTASAQVTQPAAVWQMSELGKQTIYPFHGGAVLS